MVRLSVAVGAVFILAVLVGMSAVFPRMFLGHAMHRMTGAEMSADNVAFAGGLRHFVATNLELRNASGSAILKAPRADIDLGGGEPRVVLDRPAAVVSRADLATIVKTFSHFGSGTLEIKDGSFQVQSALDVESIDGKLHANERRLSYDIRGDVIDQGISYPFHGGTDEDAGITIHSWSAASLPIAPLIAVAASPDLQIAASSGQLHDVTLTAQSTSRKLADFHADAELAAGALQVGVPTHTIAGLHGKLVVDADSIGSKMVEGTVDGVPLTLVGRLEDYDVGRFEELLLDVAAEPNLREAHLEATAPGVAFAKYRLESDHGRLAIFVSSVDTKNPTISLNSVLAGDHVTSGGERTSTMGQRTGAVMGIDGDYFDIGGSYAPQGILIISGKLLRSPTKRYAMTVHRGNHVTFDEYTFAGKAIDGEHTIPIHDFNVFPPGKVGIVTSAFGKLRPHIGTTFVALDAVPGTTPGENGEYRVTHVGPIDSVEPATMGLAFGRYAEAKPPRVGDTITIEYHLTPNYDDIVTAEGGGPLMIRDGKWIEDPDAPAKDEHDVRWPVVGVGRLEDDSLLFFEVDGRWPDISVGMTRPEFGDLMLRYHVVDGFAMDSGGSAGIVSRIPGDKEVSV
ncbi:MAG TPA: phosphodiester glycosidase family protein, partial [Candidatus Acidoferrales bacterium]|nr:phosphodiester glycosidase family protein [Candidatus Acidoferrales bacterium]